MICLSCDSKNIRPRKIKCEGEIKGERVETISEKTVCDDCGESFLTEIQMAEFRRDLADSYRTSHELLTSKQIKEYRNRLGLNQIDFARMIGAGDSSVKRWESNRVQDRVYDTIIRARCDPSYMSDNIVINMEDLATEDEYTGFCKFRLARYIKLLACIVPFASSPLYFFKVLFIMDEKHFRKFGSTISGLRYAALEYGPVPDDYRRINEYIVKHGYASTKGMHNFVINTKFDSTEFTDSENEVIEEVTKLLKEKGEKYCYEKSHESNLYKTASPYGLIKFVK
ncbi:MAG: DUF4065 domain-containing protein [Deltaproteobacteria bacterium]|nr:DUF4065 domain-containing protein [Deltaproteobacteria bacterium]